MMCSLNRYCVEICSEMKRFWEYKREVKNHKNKIYLITFCLFVCIFHGNLFCIFRLVVYIRKPAKVHYNYFFDCFETSLLVRQEQNMRGSNCILFFVFTHASDNICFRKFLLFFFVSIPCCVFGLENKVWYNPTSLKTTLFIFSFTHFFCFPPTNKIQNHNCCSKNLIMNNQNLMFVFFLYWIGLLNFVKAHSKSSYTWIFFW